MAKAPTTEKLRIAGPQGNLEALLEIPEGQKDGYIAVLCHPHPQHHGTMLNKVVQTMSRALNDLGMPTIRFNFRGVGASDGKYADGEGEIDDVVAVADFVRQRWPDAGLWLGGFSFGAVVAARAAARVDSVQLITIAPAINILGKKLTQQPQTAWLIVQGDADEIVPVDEVISWVDGLDPGPELVVLPEVGHFFHGHLVELRQTLVTNLIAATRAETKRDKET